MRARAVRLRAHTLLRRCCSAHRSPLLLLEKWGLRAEPLPLVAGADAGAGDSLELVRIVAADTT